MIIVDSTNVKRICVYYPKGRRVMIAPKSKATLPKEIEALFLEDKGALEALKMNHTVIVVNERKRRSYKTKDEKPVPETKETDEVAEIKKQLAALKFKPRSEEKTAKMIELKKRLAELQK